MMPKVISKDGTKIAYTKAGNGPALIIVDGALCYRDFGPSQGLSKLLQGNFTVYTYDRRGRGESGDTQPYSPERETEDIEALIDATCGSAYIFGQSSGAVLAIEATNMLTSKVSKLAAYECPLFLDNTRDPMPPDFMDKLRANIESGNNSAAVKQFMRLVGTPAFFVAIMPLMPMWKKLKTVAPSLLQDFSFMEAYQQGVPLSPNHWANVTAQTFIMVGSKSPTWMQNASKQVTVAVPKATHKVIEGQNHMVKSAVLAPILSNFYIGNRTAKHASLQTSKAGLTV